MNCLRTTDMSGKRYWWITREYKQNWFYNLWGLVPNEDAESLFKMSSNLQDSHRAALNQVGTQEADPGYVTAQYTNWALSKHLFEVPCLDDVKIPPRLEEENLHHIPMQSFTHHLGSRHFGNPVSKRQMNALQFLNFFDSLLTSPPNCNDHGLFSLK